MDLREENRELKRRLAAAEELLREKGTSEAALRDSEARLSLALAATNLAAYEWDLDSDHLTTNARFRELVGIGPDEPIIGARVLEFCVHPDDRPQIDPQLARAMDSSSDGKFVFEHRLSRVGPLGHPWVLSHGQVYFAGPPEARRPTRVFGTLQDITERRQAEQALRASDESYRAELEWQVRERTAELQQSRDLLQATLDSSMDMIQVFESVRNEQGDIVDFRWVLNNHTSESKYGEVRGESLLQRNPGVVEEGIFDAFRRVVETGEPVIADRHYVHEQFNGWFFQSAVKLGDGVATTTKDITGWKQAQEEVLRLRDEVAQTKLRESEDKYRTLFNAIDEGFAIFEMIFDAGGQPVDFRYIETNDGFERQAGRRPRPGQTMRELFPEAKDMWLNDYAEVVRTGTAKRFVDYNEGLDRWFDVYVFPTVAPRERDQLAALFSDVTERKRAEAALRESEERIAADLDAVTRLQRAGAICAQVDCPESEALAVLLDAAVFVTAAAKGNFQLLDTATGRLRIAAQHGFDERFLNFFDVVAHDDAAACGAALHAGNRVAIPDVRESDVFRGQPALQVLLDAGVQAVQSTPLVSSSGRVLGMISTHYSEPHPPIERELGLMDLLARQAADYLERRRAEAALRKSELKYRNLFESMGQGYSLNEIVRDADGQAIDLRYLELNPAFERLTGASVNDARGQLASEVFPGLDRYWIDICDRAVREGVMERVEHELTPNGRWYQSNFYPAGGDFCLSLYDDITERKRAEALLRESEERQAFLLRLTDALRPLDAAAEIQGEATRLLREHLAAGWCYYVEWDEAAMRGVVLRDSTRDGLPSLAGSHDVSDVPAFLDMLRTGNVLNVRDYGGFDGLSPELRARYTALGFRSMLVATLVKEGSLIASLLVGDTEVRDWSRNAEALLTETAERTWAAVGRARAEAALRESEERYRELFERINEGFCIIQVIFEEGKPVDYRFLAVNSAFERHTGITNAAGRLMREIAPEHEQHWFDHYGKVALTGQAARFEARAEALGDRWYEVNAFRVGTPEQRRVAIVFSDITERIAREENQRLLVDISEVLSRLSDEEEMIRTVSAKLVSHLNVSCYQYVDVDEERAEVTIRYFWHALDMPPSRGTFPIADFLTPQTLRNMRSGEITCRYNVQGDLSDDGPQSAALKAGAAAQKIASYVTVPYSQSGKWKSYFAVADSRPRRWTVLETELVQQVSNLLFPRIERARAEAALRKSEARIRTIADLAPVLIWETDASGAVFVNQHYLDFFGVDFEAVHGMQWSQFLHPEDAADYLAKYHEAFVLRQSYTHECRLRRADGEYRWLLITAVPGIDRLVGVCTDITEREKAESALRESEERFRLLVDNVQEYALFQTDLEGRVTSWNPGAERLFGYTTAEMLAQPMERLLTPEDQQARVLAQEKDRVLAGEHAEDARWMVRKNGSRFWAQWVTEPVRDAAGQLRGVAKVMRDETERKRAEERQQLLIGELNHRVKNTLATVQAMVSHTLRSTSDPQEFSTRFQQRLQALSRAHNLLTRSSWEGAEVAEIVREELELEGDGERVTALGPPAFLDAQSSLALAMVLHELGTNARKYGALSVPEGRLTIRWGIDTSIGVARLQLHWTEQGGPTVHPPEKPGFGTRLINSSLRGVGGKTVLHFDSDGVRCRLELPLGSGPGEGLSRRDIQLR